VIYAVNKVEDARARPSPPRSTGPSKGPRRFFLYFLQVGGTRLRLGRRAAVETKLSYSFDFTMELKKITFLLSLVVPTTASCQRLKEPGPSPSPLCDIEISLSLGAGDN